MTDACVHLNLYDLRSNQYLHPLSMKYKENIVRYTFQFKRSRQTLMRQEITFFKTVPLVLEEQFWLTMASVIELVSFYKED